MYGIREISNLLKYMKLLVLVGGLKNIKKNMEN